MLYLVGLGLADEKDITVKGLEIVKKAERVYLEAYTAVLLVEKDVLVSRRQGDWPSARNLISTAVGVFLWPRSHHCRP
jgi:diphthamide biosynthesis methyltransferase